MSDREAKIEPWSRMLGPEAAPLLVEAAALGDITPREVERLRKRWPADLVAVAIELTRARSRAGRKFPEPSRIVADVEGVEQASSHATAHHKSRRFARIAPGRIVDLCCGIGGDAMDLVRVAPVLAIDHDPLRAWMTERNAGCDTRVADVTATPLGTAAFHLDPDRRDRGGTRRRWRYADYQPGPSFIESLIDTNPDGAVKLGPGVAFEELPHPSETEVELINEDGVLVQAVLWTGRLAFNPGRRTATRLPGGETFTAVPEPPPVSQGGVFGRYVHVPDPALERAGLLGPFARDHHLETPHRGLGLLSSDAPVLSPWLTGFEILESMAWRPERVRQWLHDHDGGLVEVKTRDRVVDPDHVQRTLRGPGDRPFTVFVVRLGVKVRALIARRHASPAPPPAC